MRFAISTLGVVGEVVTLDAGVPAWASILAAAGAAFALASWCLETPAVLDHLTGRNLTNGPRADGSPAFPRSRTDQSTQQD